MLGGSQENDKEGALDESTNEAIEGVVVGEGGRDERTKGRGGGVR